jgi:hypothetical protein
MYSVTARILHPYKMYPPHLARASVLLVTNQTAPIFTNNRYPPSVTALCTQLPYIKLLQVHQILLCYVQQSGNALASYSSCKPDITAHLVLAEHPPQPVQLISAQVPEFGNGLDDFEGLLIQVLLILPDCKVWQAAGQNGQAVDGTLFVEQRWSGDDALPHDLLLHLPLVNRIVDGNVEL